MRNSKGFTLLEVMIAVFVLAIGLLGIAALQMTGVKNNQTASQRSQATELSYSLIDRMRANAEGVIAGNYLGTAAPAVAYNCFNNFTGTTIVAKCSAGEMAAADLDRWFTLIRAALPGATAAITCINTAAAIIAADTAADDCLAGSQHIISISWRERLTREEDVNDGTVDGFETRTLPMSFVL